MIPSTMTSKVVKVGDRIECLGHFGTVKYVGALDGYADIWYGIDWDDHDRGRHNGCVKGVQYFAASGSTSGSFIRPDKVQTGQSCSDAITTRYGQWDDGAAAKLTEQQLRQLQHSINAPFLEMVGFDKIAQHQSDFKSLQVVNLRLQNVSCIGKPGELHALCPNIMEIEVSKNLLTKWTQIFLICEQLEHLKWINVSENFLAWPEDTKGYCYENMKTLICGSMGLTWDLLIKISKVFPNLEELRTPRNEITSLDTSKGDFEGLLLLDLEGNRIEDWGEVCKLSCIDTLEQLNLEHTGLKKIYFERSDMFMNLKKVVLSSNLIDTWESVGELNKLRKLEDLRFLRNPIMEDETYATCIQLIVARIANLTVFNGATVNPVERKGAEYDYLKKYGLEWLSVRFNPEKRAEFIAQHNRYDELINKYGTPEESELTVQSKLIKASLIDVNFVHITQTISKRIPPTILIQKLIILAQRLFKLETRPSLTYISGIQSEIEIELTDEGKELGFYSVQNGDKIIVKI